MNKLNGQSQASRYISGMKVSEIRTYDELTGDRPHQQSKSRIRQDLHILLDKASSKKERIIIITGA